MNSQQLQAWCRYHDQREATRLAATAILAIPPSLSRETLGFHCPLPLPFITNDNPFVPFYILQPARDNAQRVVLCQKQAQQARDGQEIGKVKEIHPGNENSCFLREVSIHLHFFCGWTPRLPLWFTNSILARIAAISSVISELQGVFHDISAKNSAEGFSWWKTGFPSSPNWIGLQFYSPAACAAGGIALLLLIRLDEVSLW